MADQNLNITVSVAGEKEIDNLFQKFEDGKTTLKDITQLKKELNATFKELQVGSAEWNRYAGMLAKVNDFQRDVRIQTKAGHEEYFKLGLEIRQLVLASGMLQGQLGSLASAFSSSVGGALGLKQALIPLGVQMNALPLAGVALGIAAITTALLLMADNTEKAAERMEKMRTAAVAIAELSGKGISPERAKAELEDYKKKLRAAEAELRVGQEIIFASEEQSGKEAPSGPGSIPKARARMSEEDQKLLEKRIVNLKAFVDDRQKLVDSMVSTDTEALNKKGEEIEKFIAKWGEDAWFGGFGGIGTKAKDLIGAKTKAKKQFNVDAGEKTPIVANIDAADKAWVEFAGTFNAGIDGMVRAIPQIGTAFASAFGGAKTVMGSFVESFTNAIQEMAIRAAAFWAVSQIPVIGPIIAALGTRASGGPVSSGRPYIVGERGPELFVPRSGGEIVSNSQSARFGGMSSGGMQTVNVVGVIRGNDIQLVNDKAGLARKGRMF